MLPPDVELIQLINRTGSAYVANAPAFITYREFTHAGAASLGRSQDINRSVAVRQADNFAVMQDLPQGLERTGQAFPIIPYFDPFPGFAYRWFANLKNVDISVTRYPPAAWPLPPADTGATMSLTYISFWEPQYANDSTEARVHLRVLPTPALQTGQYYPYDIIEDPVSHLPSHLELRFVGDSTRLQMDYQILQGHWVMTHAVYTAPQHVGPLNFTIVTDTKYQDMAFPATAPDPRLAGTPAPTAAPQ